MKRSLLLGCGSRRTRLVHLPDQSEDFDKLVTVDINEAHKPNLVWDLTNPTPLPFADDSFDEICMFDVWEHLGQQGDVPTFFRQWMDYYRLLKDGGLFLCRVPDWRTEWALGDPGHSRVLTPGTLVFLNQEEYRKQVGVTPMSDYRHLWRGDFQCIAITNPNDCAPTLDFVLRAIKPARLS